MQTKPTVPSSLVWEVTMVRKRARMKGRQHVSWQSQLVEGFVWPLNGAFASRGAWTFGEVTSLPSPRSRNRELGLVNNDA